MNLPNGVCQILARHEMLFAQGDAGDLTSDYRHPVAVFLPDGLRVEETPEQTRQVLRALQEHAHAAGVVRFVKLILRTRALRADRPAVTVSWRFLDAQGQEVARNRLTYFFAVQADGAFRIEMLDYERVAFAVDRQAWVLSTHP